MYHFDKSNTPSNSHLQCCFLSYMSNCINRNFIFFINKKNITGTVSFDSFYIFFYSRQLFVPIWHSNWVFAWQALRIFRLIEVSWKLSSHSCASVKSKSSKMIIRQCKDKLSFHFPEWLSRISIGVVQWFNVRVLMLLGHFLPCSIEFRQIHSSFSVAKIVRIFPIYRKYFFAFSFIFSMKVISDSYGASHDIYR